MLNLNNNSFYNYYLEDGIRTLKYAEGAYLKSSDGLFLFGGLTGITYFDPAEFSAKSLPECYAGGSIRLRRQSK